jgi:hypothetical protein
MGYTDITPGRNMRKGTSGPLAPLKGKPTDKMKTAAAGHGPGLGPGGGGKTSGSGGRKSK